MAFMEPQVTQKCDWYRIETNNGTWFVPVDVPGCTIRGALSCFEAEDEDVQKELLQFTDGSELVDDVTVFRGYGVRLSAPGYLDCTPWDVYTNKREAMRAARDLHDD